MKNVHGVLIFHVQHHQCLYLVVMIIRYYATYLSILTKSAALVICQVAFDSILR